MLHKELVKEIDQLPRELKQLLLDASWNSVIAEVSRSVLSWTHDEAQTEDIVQAAFLRILSHIEQAREKPELTNLQDYLTRTALNIYYDRSNQPESRLQAHSPRDLLEVIFRGTSPQEREIYQAWVEGKGVQQIAQQTNLSPGVVRYQLTKFRAKIRYRAKKYLQNADSRNVFETSGFEDETIRRERQPDRRSENQPRSRGTLSQRLHGILKFDGNPPNDEEVKDLVADYLIRKYS